LEKSPPQPGQRQWSQWKHQRHANENDDEEIGMRIHPVMLSGAKHLSIQTCFEKQPLTRDSSLRSE
jgi:hypothetical protein